jgi:hypothetical protein
MYKETRDQMTASRLILIKKVEALLQAWGLSPCSSHDSKSLTIDKSKTKSKHPDYRYQSKV